MLTAQIESFCSILPELGELFTRHWEEVALHRDKVPLAPDVVRYRNLEDSGQLLCTTLRLDGKLVGYFVGFLWTALHYKDCLELTMDILFVHPDCRGKRGGKKLLDLVLKEAKRRGVKRVFMGHKTHLPEPGRLYKILGFEEVEKHYCLWIGE
jgi:GNAT superfamily N-acetyltransferase